MTETRELKGIMPFLDPLPRLSKAEKFAADFFRAEKRLQLEEEHQEALIRRSGDVVLPTLQVVRNVNFVNMPNLTQMRNTGVNASTSPGLPGAPPPSNDFPRRPPPPNGSPKNHGNQMRGFPRPNVTPRHDRTAPDVAVINPLNGSINITDTSNIRDLRNRMTTEAVAPPAPVTIQQPVPDPVPNPVNREDVLNPPIFLLKGGCYKSSR